MWLLILIIIFIISSLICYERNKSFLSPTFLFSIMMLFSLVLMALNYRNWDVELSLNFVIIILVGFLAFILGSNLSFAKKHNYFYANNVIISRRIKYPYRLFAIISLVAFAIYLVLTIRQVGFEPSISGFLRKVYNAQIDLTSNDFIYNQFGKIIVAVSYISVFQFYNLLFKKVNKQSKSKRISKYLYLFFCLLIAVLYIIIATDRNVLLRFFIYITALWIIFFTRNRHHSRSYLNRKLLGYVFLLGIVFVLAFYIAGKIKQYQSNFSTMISIYGGSGLQDFNLFVNNFDGNYLMGRNTFSALISLLQRFGIMKNVELVDAITYPGFITYNATNGYVFSSNIYSAYQPFYSDFGIFGVAIFLFVQGLVLGKLYRLCKSNNKFYWILYAAFIYSVFYIPILDQFYSRMHLGLIYEIFYLCLFYVIAFRGPKKIIILPKKEAIKERGVYLI